MFRKTILERLRLHSEFQSKGQVSADAASTCARFAGKHCKFLLFVYKAKSGLTTNVFTEGGWAWEERLWSGNAFSACGNRLSIRKLARPVPPKIWLGSNLSGVRLRPQLCELFSNGVRIAVLRINLEDAFQVLLGQSRLFCLGVGQSEVIMIRGVVRLFVLR